MFDKNATIPLPEQVDDSTIMKKEFTKVCSSLIDAYCGLIGMYQTEFNEKIVGMNER